MKKKTWLIIVIAAAAAAAVFLLWKFVFSGGTDVSADGGEVYVVSVRELVSGGGAIGAQNRFSGVVESQETWSVNQNPDSVVKKVMVKVGDEVKKGQTLFTYDIEKYKSDQDQAEIELERLENELDTIIKAIEQLEKDQKRAPASEQADYTIRVQDAELQKKQKELDIKSKNITINKLKENQKNASVKSEIDGVVRTINDGTSAGDIDGSDSGAFMTIMKTGDLRVKGTINEQNIGQIMVGSPVLIHSRIDEDVYWTGSISEINTDSTVSNQNTFYYGGGGGEGSSNYNFFVTVDDTEGMMIGQHVYLELDNGQMETEDREGLWIPSYFIDLADPEAPCVWVDDGTGRITRREVVTGEEDWDMMLTEISDGLTEDDMIAFPDGTIEEGMTTAAEGAA